VILVPTDTYNTSNTDKILTDTYRK